VLKIGDFARSGPLVPLYFEVDPNADEFDLFVGGTVYDSPHDETTWVHVSPPAGELLASVIYRGNYPEIGSAFAALGCWLLSGGLIAAGPCREVYHRSPIRTSDPSENVNEIQFPVTPARMEPASPRA
jgi:effector-binding domain-containing protein